MATVDKDPTRKKTPWVVRWRDDQGTQRKKGFARKVDADRFRAEIEHSLNVGSYVDPAGGRVTFEAYAERWREMQPHRPNTAKRVKSSLTKHVYPAFGRRPMAAIRPSELQAFVTGLPLAPSAVRPLFATLRAIFAAARRDRIIGSNPSEGIKLPEMPRALIVPLTVDQVDALTLAMPTRYRALMIVGAGTGLRQGELFGLRAADVDLEARTLSVERQVQPAEGGGALVGPLKNKDSYRNVPLGDVVTGALRRHLEDYPPEGDGSVFRDETGRLLTRAVFNKQVWYPARKKAELPTVGMHDLRHFYASALIRAGLNAKVVASRLGHADASMTLRVYTHLWPDDEDRSRQAIDDLLTRENPPA